MRSDGKRQNRRRRFTERCPSAVSPNESERVAIRIRRRGRVQSHRCAELYRLRSTRLRDRRSILDAHRGHCDGRVRRAVVDDERHRVGADLDISMRRLRARRRRSVAKMPRVGQRLSIRVGRAAGVKHDRLPPESVIGPAGIRHRNARSATRRQTNIVHPPSFERIV